MLALVVTAFGETDVLQVVEQPIPEPSEGQIRIRVKAASVNFADVMARQGRYHNASQPPFVPGLDVAGTVDAVGAGVTTFVSGQRVVAFPSGGSYSEYTLADVALTYAIPETITFDTAAAMLTVSVTSYELLTKVTHLLPGERVLVHAAAGGIGTVALQLAKHLGAGLVIGTVGRDEKMAVAKAHGADVVINYSHGSFADAVMAATDSHGVDVILDSVAGDAFSDNLRCLANFGRIAAFGSASGKPGYVATTELHGSCRSVLGYSMGTTRRLRKESLRASVEAVLTLAANDQLMIPISARFPFEEGAKAHKFLESRTSTGKILLTMDRV